MLQRSHLRPVIIIVGMAFLCGCEKNSVDNATQGQAVSHTKDQLSTAAVSLSPITLCEALRRGADTLKVPHHMLTPVNDTQKNFVSRNYIPYVQEKDYERFSSGELKAYVSDDYQKLNSIIKSNGFSVQLEPFPKSSLGVVAIQDIIIKWLKEGTKTTITSDGASYDGAHLREHVDFFAKPGDDSIVIAEILTKTDDKVYFVVKRDGDLFESAPEAKAVSQAIAQYRAEMHNGIYHANKHYDGVKFPMIMYQEKPDISWIVKLQIGGREIAQALQEVIFKMNEKGAHVKAVAAIEMRATAAPGGFAHIKETLIIDKPFLIWVERPNVAQPIFAEYMPRKYWSNPGELPA